MPAGPDRYEPLREAARQAENRVEDKETPTQDAQKGPHEQQAANAHAAQEVQAEIAENGPTRPASMPNSSPGWSADADLESQNRSANKYNAWVNASHNERPSVPEQVEQQPQAKEHDGDSQQLPLNQEPPRNCADLKNQQSQTSERAEPSAEVKDAAKSADAKKPALTFNWDREQGHEHDR